MCTQCRSSDDFRGKLTVLLLTFLLLQIAAGIYLTTRGALLRLTDVKLNLLRWMSFVSGLLHWFR
jgi:hypothetical protein